MNEAQVLEKSRNSPGVLFDFESVVIVGASDDPTRIGGVPIFLLKKYGYAGRIYGINPKRDLVQGIPCFAEVKDLPEQVDVAIFCVAAEKIRTLLPELKAKGLKGAVIFSAGFTESGEQGQALQKWLTSYARQNSIAILGPNCVGQISFATGRSLTFANAFLTFPVTPPGRVALLSQSGGVATNIWADALIAGTRFSHVITTGNEADLGFADFLEYLADDDRTDVVIGYIEALQDGPGFCRAAARLRAAGKPLVLIKVGTSAAGRDAVSSHTGQLSSDDSAYQAAFDRYGVIRARTLEELNDFARVFSLGRIRPKITAATTSGGAGVYVADLCADLGIEMSNLSLATETSLSTIVPSYGRVRNPVDLTAQVVNDISILRKSLEFLLNDPETGVLLFLLSGKGTLEQSTEVIDVMTDVQRRTDKKIVLCWLGVSDDVRRRGSDAGLTVYQDPARFLRPLKRYLDATRADSPNTAEAFVALSAQTEPAPKGGPNLKDGLVLGQDGRWVLPERQSMEWLEHFNVPCPRRWYARSADAVVEIGAQVTYPCVMKLVEPVVAHKSDVGGVVVNIASAHELLQAWLRMSESLLATEVLVAEQIESGLEVIVGCLHDETFGMRLTVGSGGVWTNFVSDAITLVPPFSDAYIRSELPRLGLWGPLNGARGQRAYAVDALVRTIADIARAGWAMRGDIREFECNPVIVTSQRAVAVDAIGFV